MHFKSGDEDTICALSTAPGTGGIAVIRVSGSRALLLTRKICSFLPGEPESHKVFYGVCRRISPSEPVDEVLVSYFADGRSFTGEETLEISCHGGPVLTSTILKELVHAGCRLANRGEFTYRAFMNGRLDLVQAESVLSLIESQTQQASRIALRQLQGRLSAEFSRLEDDLLWLLAQLEASIDFSTEGLETSSTADLLQRSRGLQERLESLVASYAKGRLIREGIQIALVGRPNVGKSSLLNAILKEEKAIVTSHAGTTRDLIEGTVSFSGIPATFVDTAGLRETENEIEKIGIARARAAMDKADFIFYILDPTDAECEKIFESYLAAAQANSYFLFNKCDLSIPPELKQKLRSRSTCGGFENRVFWISARSGDGLDLLEELVANKVRGIEGEDSSVVTQARHLELLQKIHSCLLSAIGLMREDSSPEFVAFELQVAIRSVHELLGKEFDEQVIDRIFQEFCLGK